MCGAKKIAREKKDSTTPIWRSYAKSSWNNFSSKRRKWYFTEGKWITLGCQKGTLPIVSFCTSVCYPSNQLPILPIRLRLWPLANAGSGSESLNQTYQTHGQPRWRPYNRTTLAHFWVCVLFFSVRIFKNIKILDPLFY